MVLLKERFETFIAAKLAGKLIIQLATRQELTGQGGCVVYIYMKTVMISDSLLEVKFGESQGREGKKERKKVKKWKLFVC